MEVMGLMLGEFVDEYTVVVRVDHDHSCNDGAHSFGPHE